MNNQGVVKDLVVSLDTFFNQIKRVDPYLQRRCGTLDCHGQPGRAYRIYGFTGFRLYNEDAGLDIVTSSEIHMNPELDLFARNLHPDFKEVLVCARKV